MTRKLKAGNLARAAHRLMGLTCGGDVYFKVFQFD
jgi:hypothetical protein